MRIWDAANSWLALIALWALSTGVCAQEISLPIGQKILRDWEPGANLALHLPADERVYSVIRIGWLAINSRAKIDAKTHHHPVGAYGAIYHYLAPGQSSDIVVEASPAPRPSGRLSLERVAVNTNVLTYVSAIDAYKAAGEAVGQDGFSGYAEASAHYRIAGNTASRVNSRIAKLLTADTAHALGEVAFYREDAATVADSYSTAAQLYASIDQPELAAAAENSLGIWRMDHFDFDQAAAAFARAEDRVSDMLPGLAVLIRGNGCQVLLNRLQLNEAETCLLDVIRLSEDLDHRRLWLASINALGGVYSSQGQPAEALPLFERLVAELQDEPTHHLRPLAHNNLGLQYRELGQMDLALKNYQISLQTYQAQGNIIQSALLSRNIGNAYWHLGDFDQAERFFNQALSLYEQIDNKPGIRQTTQRLARLALGRGDAELALSMYKTSYAETLVSEDFAATHKAASGIVQSFIQLGQPSAALEALADVETVAKRFDASLTLQASTELLRSDIFRLQGNYLRAYEHANAARDDYESANYAAGITTSLESLGLIAMLRGDLESAVRHASQAIEIERLIRGSIASAELRQLRGATDFSGHRLLTEIRLRQNEQYPDGNFDRAAFKAAGQARAQSLTEVLGGSTIASQGNPDKIRRRSELTSQLSQLADRADVDDDRLIKILSELDTIDAELASVAGGTPKLADSGAISVGELQALLRPGELFLHYEDNEYGHVVFAASNSVFRSQRFSVSDKAKTSGRALIAALRSGAPLDMDALKALSSAYLAPIAPLLAESTHVLVLNDMTLKYLPFDLLINPTTTKHVVDTHAVTQFPSATTLHYLREQAELRANKARKIVAFADPIFSPTDPRLLGKNAPAGQYDDRPALNRLPLGAVEVDRIAEQLSEELTIQTFVGANANRTSFLDDRSTSADILHIATHGIVNIDRQDLTGLTLSRFDAEGQTITGFVGLRDLYRSSMDARLVVLSACETALGRDLGAEGLAGLSHAFLFAGAQSVIASLWQVQDRSTAELMAAFYKNLLQNKLPAAVALQRAKLEIRENRAWRHPYYWAGFTVQGEFDPN